MALVLLGIVLVLLKLIGLGPFGGFAWPWVLAPFVAAVVWWKLADATGLTRRRIERRIERKVASRRRRQLAWLGLRQRGEPDA